MLRGWLLTRLSTHKRLRTSDRAITPPQRPVQPEMLPMPTSSVRVLNRLVRPPTPAPTTSRSLPGSMRQLPLPKPPRRATRLLPLPRIVRMRLRQSTETASRHRWSFVPSRRRSFRTSWSRFPPLRLRKLTRHSRTLGGSSRLTRRSPKVATWTWLTLLVRSLRSTV